MKDVVTRVLPPDWDVPDLMRAYNRAVGWDTWPGAPSATADVLAVYLARDDCQRYLRLLAGLPRHFAPSAAQEADEGITFNGHPVLAVPHWPMGVVGFVTTPYAGTTP